MLELESLTIEFTLYGRRAIPSDYDRGKAVKSRMLRQHPEGFGNCHTEPYIAVSIETLTNVLLAQCAKVDVESRSAVH